MAGRAKLMPPLSKLTDEQKEKRAGSGGLYKWETAMTQLLAEGRDEDKKRRESEAGLAVTVAAEEVDLKLSDVVSAKMSKAVPSRRRNLHLGGDEVRSGWFLRR